MRKLLLALSLLLACLASAAESPIAPDQRRGVEQTFLTFPEWFLVHSPAEYARYVKQHPAHGEVLLMEANLTSDRHDRGVESAAEDPAMTPRVASAVALVLTLGRFSMR